MKLSNPPVLSHYHSQSLAPTGKTMDHIMYWATFYKSFATILLQQLVRLHCAQLLTPLHIIQPFNHKIVSGIEQELL